VLSALCVNTSAITVYCCGSNNCNTPDTEVINSQVTSCYVGGTTVTPIQTACPNTGSNMCAVNFCLLYLYNNYIHLY
jgi:hypothetical protein